MSWKRVHRGTRNWNRFVHNKKKYKLTFDYYWVVCQYYDGHVSVMKSKYTCSAIQKKVNSYYTKDQPLCYYALRKVCSNKEKPKIPIFFRVQNILISIGLVVHGWKRLGYNAIK